MYEPYASDDKVITHACKSVPPKKQNCSAVISNNISSIVLALGTIAVVACSFALFWLEDPPRHPRYLQIWCSVLIYQVPVNKYISTV